MPRTYDYNKSSPQFPKPAPGTTHVAAPISAADFRAKATGVGNTCAVSLATGQVRSQTVVDCASRLTAGSTQLAVAGYPPKTGYPGLCVTPYQSKGIGY